MAVGAPPTPLIISLVSSDNRFVPFGNVLLNELWRLCVVCIDVLCMLMTPWVNRTSSFFGSVTPEEHALLVVEIWADLQEDLPL